MSWYTLFRSLLFLLPAEWVHHAAMRVFVNTSKFPGLQSWISRRCQVTDNRLTVYKFGIRFANPVGLAAGFDKEGRWFSPLASLGFSHIEIGTVTGQRQPGNPKPRLFRLPSDQALINRMGFNSSGCLAVAQSLSRRISLKPQWLVLGVNIGKSKIVELENAPQELQAILEQLFDYADYFTINVSSPNTPGLRELQSRKHLVALIEAVDQRNRHVSQSRGLAPKPLLLKIAPDLSLSQLIEIAAIARDWKVSGVIATNTTIERQNLNTPGPKILRIGAGGLSGRPLQVRSLQVVSTLYQQLQGKVPLIGVGGIMNGQDAWNMIAAGADLIQIYTGLIYGGPSIVRDINRFLLDQLERHRFENISQVVGTQIAVDVDDLTGA